MGWTQHSYHNFAGKIFRSKGNNTHLSKSMIFSTIRETHSAKITRTCSNVDAWILCICVMSLLSTN